MRAYRELFASRGVPRLVLAAALSRLTTSMLGLSLAVAVSQVRGSLADAGLVLTGHALSVAVFAPVAGRLADRLGPRPILLGYLVGHALAYAGLLVALQQQVATGLIGAAAVTVGATTPPASPVVRGRWPVVVAADRVRTAYAFDSALNSATFIAGPVVAGLLILAVSPPLAILAGATAKVAGDLLLATTPGLVRVAETGTRRLLGPIGNGQVRLVLAVIALDTFGYGCLDIAAVALGNGRGVVAGVVLGTMAAGEVIGGLCYGARLWPGRLRGQLVVLHLGTAAVFAMISLVTGLLLVVLFFLAAGLAGGARDTLNQLLLTETAPAVYRTEAFSWLGTFMWTGFGIGTAVAGQLQSRLGTPSVFLAAAAASVLAAGVARTVRVSSSEPAMTRTPR